MKYPIVPLKFMLSGAFICLFAFIAPAQSDSTSADPEKAELNIEFRFKEINNQTRILEAVVKTKVDKSYVGVGGVKVFYKYKTGDVETPLGDAVTKEDGLSVLIIPDAFAAKSPCHFVAAVENDTRYEDTEEELNIEESNFEMALESEDSVRQVHIRLTNDRGMPVEGVEVNLYVQRLFGLLKISEDPETTDADGEILAEFPEGIPGDTAGNIVIVAKIEDHETMGNLEFARKAAWGTPLVIDPARHARELWSSRANAPLYLVTTVNIMLAGIWGVIFYIIYQVFRIRRLGKKHQTT